MSLVLQFAKTLLALRTAKKISQAELAKRTGLSTSYISMLERAQRSPPLETVDAIGKKMRVRPVSLLK